ncbi:hypothetical protein [Massilia sp. TSP1-1-2]|uniref:hypothetical protein n=1 Tax=unclassified Massilia TaxID=2609279 RepID=UPI003CEE88ED
MVNAVVRIFDAFERAQVAREALLAEGFEASDILVSVANDEAGPVHGNFTVGNSPVESDSHTYERNYANPARNVHCIMTVAAADAALAGRADAILAQHGARAIDDPASRASLR